MDDFLLSIRYVGIERERLYSISYIYTPDILSYMRYKLGDILNPILHDILQYLQRKWLSHLLDGKVS